MTDRIWTPRPYYPKAVQGPDGGVSMFGSDYRIKPQDLLIQMALMSRNGWTRERIRRELDIHYYVNPATGAPEYVDDATFDRALARARAYLDQQVALFERSGGTQGVDPETPIVQSLQDQMREDGDD